MQSTLQLTSFLSNSSHIHQNIRQTVSLPHTLAKGVALFQTGGHFPHALADVIVVDNPRSNADRSCKLQTSSDQCGQVCGKLTGRTEKGHISKHRDFQCKLRHVHPAFFRIGVKLEDKGNGSEHNYDQENIFPEKVGYQNQRLCDQRQFCIIGCKNVHKGRYNLHHQNDYYHYRKCKDENRINQGISHFCTHFHLLVIMLIHGLKGLGQVTGFLSGADGLDENRRKQLAAPLLEAGCHASSCLNILCHFFQNAFQLFVCHFVADQPDGTADGDSGLEDNGKLGAH